MLTLNQQIVNDKPTNWPPPKVLVFIAQLVEHSSDNEEAMGSNPLEVPVFFPVHLIFLEMIKLQVLLRRSYLHLKYVSIIVITR